MRVFVKVCCSGGNGSQTYAIPCNEPTARVASLKSLALDRWSENCGGKSKRDAEHFKLTLCGTDALLSDKDAIQDVLKDGEFVNLCESNSTAAARGAFVAFYVTPPPSVCRSRGRSADGGERGLPRPTPYIWTVSPLHATKKEIVKLQLFTLAGFTGLSLLDYSFFLNF